MGVSFAIPIEVAMNTARQLRETGHVSRGQLGVAIQNVDRKFAKTLGLASSGGALVSSVTPDSAAEQAGRKGGGGNRASTSGENMQDRSADRQGGNAWVSIERTSGERS